MTSWRLLDDSSDDDMQIFTVCSKTDEQFTVQDEQ